MTPKRVSEERDGKRKAPDFFGALLKQHGLPEAVAEYRFDAIRKWRFDYAFPKQMIALEVEGAVWTQGRHTRGSGFVKDMEKYNKAAVLGWRVLKTTPKNLCSGETIEMLKAVLA